MKPQMDPQDEFDPLKAAEGGVSIGYLSKATGISPDTLRVWERRYGSPAAYRLPSGHRRYPLEEVERLRSIAGLLDRGHRPNELLRQPGPDLEELARASHPGTKWRSLFSSVESFEADKLRSALIDYGRTLHPLVFVEAVVAPLLRETGERWHAGTLNVSHEHFLSRIVADVLGTLRQEISERTPARQSPGLLLAGLPGELHELALAMTALVCSDAGEPAHLLGAATPVVDIVAAARRTNARAIATHISACGALAARPQLQALLYELPGLPLIVGGSGSAELTDLSVLRFDDLRSFDDWLRSER